LGFTPVALPFAPCLACKAIVATGLC
jgi:hypothetical protein